jgi:hypothetical protein
MMEKRINKGQSCLVLSLVFMLMFLFSFSFINAGSSFDTATSLEFVEGSVSITDSIIGEEANPIYYKFDVLKGEEVVILYEVLERKSGHSIFTETWLESIRYDSLFNSMSGGWTSFISQDSGSDSFLAGNDGFIYLRWGLSSGSSKNDISTMKITVTKTCKQGYSDDIKSCVNGEWAYKDVEDAVTGNTIAAKDCAGCIFEGKCYSTTMDFQASAGTDYYCSLEKKVVAQKSSGASCQESYECKSPLMCAEGKCQDIRKVTDKRTGQMIFARDCDGCLVGDFCYPPGDKFKDAKNIESYCTSAKQVVPQKVDGEFCRNDYECTTNFCGAEGRCTTTSSAIGSLFKRSTKQTSSSTVNPGYAASFGLLGAGILGGSEFLLGGILIFLAVLFFFSLLFWIFISAVYTRIGKNLNHSAPGLAWIPFIGPYITTYRASGMHWWPWILYGLGFVVFLLGLGSPIMFFVSLVIGVVFHVMFLIWTYKMIVALGKPGWFVLLLFLPILNLIILGVLAWGKDSNNPSYSNSSGQSQTVSTQTIAYQSPQEPQYVPQPPKSEQSVQNNVVPTRSETPNMPSSSSSNYVSSGVVQPQQEVPEKLKETIKTFIIASVILNVFLFIPNLYDGFLVTRAFSFFSLIFGIFFNIILMGLVSGLFFYYLYDALFYGFIRKIPIWGNTIFRVFFIPYLLAFAIFTPLSAFSLLFTSGFSNALTAGLMGSVLGTLGIHFYIYIILSALLGLVGAYLYAKYLDENLSKYYAW